MQHRPSDLRALLDDLSESLDSDQIALGRNAQASYATDMWPRHEIWRRMGQPAGRTPGAILFPRSESDVVAIVNGCRNHHIPLIPYGGGSGVCGGAAPVHGGVVVDMKQISTIGVVDDVDLTIDTDAGVLGGDLERTLNEQGYTLGHFPASMDSSTVGGWLAIRSAGQYSSRYGKIEDMVLALRAVLPNGSVMRTDESQRIDWNQLFAGSEGTLGVITSLRLRVYPLPEAEAFRGYRFRTLDAGFLAVRRLMQSGLQPQFVRLCDPFESLLHASGTGSSRGGVTAAMLAPIKELFADDSSTTNRRSRARFGLSLALSRPAVLNSAIDRLPVPCLLVFGFEGSPESVHVEMSIARELLEQAGGTDGGDGPGLRWKAKRDSASFNREAVFAAGAFADTLDVSCTWSRLHDVYTTVRKILSPHALVISHFCHAYAEGCAIQFTFIGYRRDPGALDRLYERVWEEALEAVTQAGGSISHNHGIGLAKRDQMRREHGAGVRLLYALKNGLDPSAILNPGKVLPDRAILE